MKQEQLDKELGLDRTDAFTAAQQLTERARCKTDIDTTQANIVDAAIILMQQGRQQGRAA